MNSTRRICICADDFGMTDGVNAAVLELIGRKRISATSCMVRRAAWARGAPWLRSVDASQVDVGLHLDFTWSPQGGSADRSLSVLIAKSYLGLLTAAAVRQEIKEQLTRFEDALQRAPAHVDGHQHVHQLPVIRHALLEELAARYGSASPALPWLRSTRPGGGVPDGGVKPQLIYALGGTALQAEAHKYRIPMSRRLLGVYAFNAQAGSYRQQLQQWLYACEDGDVLMCHPSSVEEAGVPHASARQMEYAVLRGCVFPVLSPRGPVQLVTNSSLLSVV